jgi:hypothetical protein
MDQTHRPPPASTFILRTLDEVRTGAVAAVATANSDILSPGVERSDIVRVTRKHQIPHQHLSNYGKTLRKVFVLYQYNALCNTFKVVFI